MCDRYCVSNHVGTAIANAALTDYGVITEAFQSQVIRPSKLATEKHKYRMSIREKEGDERN